MIYLQTRIEKEFQKNNIIIVNNVKTNEIQNYKIFLNDRDILNILNEENIPKDISFDANLEGDNIERNQILDFFAEFDFSDINTRQAVFQPKYQENDSLAACISCIQVIIRNDKLFIYVHQRSCNYDNNFWFDLQTFCYLRSFLCELYDLRSSEIEIRIVSLHRIIK